MSDSLRERSREAANMVARGASFNEVEEAIDEMTELTDEERAAVWLAAWSEQPRRRQRYELRQTIALMGARGGQPVRAAD